MSPAMMRQSIWDYFVDKPFDLMMNDLSGTIGVLTLSHVQCQSMLTDLICELTE